MHPEPVPPILYSFLDGSFAHDTDHDMPQRPEKRRKTAEAVTSSVSNGNLPANSPHVKHLEPQTRSTRRSRKSIVEIEDNAEGFLTLARVDMNLVFASSRLGQCSSHVTQESHIEMPVLLEKFEIGRTSETFRFCLTTPLGDALLNIEAESSIDIETLDVLRHVVQMSRAQKGRSIRSLCVLSRISENIEYSYDHKFRLCCRILIRNAGDLLDGLPFHKKNVFDRYEARSTSKTYNAWKPADFYEHVHVPGIDGVPFDTGSAGHPLQALQCQLYSFQKRALAWLLRREGVRMVGKNVVESSAVASAGKLPHGFVHTKDVDGTDCFISHCLGIATKDPALLRDTASQLRGGILAEEMGLGKTVELVALISLHKRGSTNVFGSPTPDVTTTTSSATLIITPPAILQQWKNEIATLAPHLKVLIYEGIRNDAKGIDNNKDRVNRLAEHDVVLTTYNVLGREIHYAAGAQPDRSMRQEKRYERKQSPLTQIDWWRVVLDEAQMVENGVSNAAKVAQLIPRQNAWAVSGTPVIKDAKDLYGLLIFLRYQPYCLSTSLWERLVVHYRPVFWQIFEDIALRHTKDQIKDEILLPPQTRVVINVPFTQIEEQHYSTMFQEMCDDCGVDLNGAPLRGDWDSTSAAMIEKLRSWLSRLRQSCLHPQVGLRNRKALGSSKVPLRTVREVLFVMTEQNEMASRQEERGLLLSRARRGQVLEHANRSRDALQIWQQTLEEAKIIVDDCREQLSQELCRSATDTTAGPSTGDPNPDNADVNRVGVYRQRLRSALEVQHMCTFFIASAYYQIKSDESLTTPGSMAYEDLGRAEERNYERAKVLRQEMLLDVQEKADMNMNKVYKRLSNGQLVSLPEIKHVKELGGIQTRNLLAKIGDLIIAINKQAAQLVEWRSKLADLVLLPLVDKDDTELAGDEYEISTKQQDEVYVYMDALRAIVSDRHDLLTGQTNERIKFEMRSALDQANAGIGHSPELLKKLLLIRQTLLPDEWTGSVRGIISELRDLRTTLRSHLERGNTRAGAELLIANSLLQAIREISTTQSKIVVQLDAELDMFKNTVDSRLEYYRQLQHISDTVAPFEEDMSEENLARVLANMEIVEARARDRIAMFKTRGRYLLHLRDESTSTETQRHCIICREQFEIGVLTSCGHTYCVECARLWWQSHKNCPTCKKHLLRTDFHQISYKPQELTVEDPQSKGKVVDASADSVSTSIYSGITRATLDQIKDIDLDGSFGTKIDTLARHILWIRENDPGAKSVIFSQYKDFLHVLARAFTDFRIAFSTFDKPNGVKRFKDDPGMECFFLHAKAQASGLNLVNATHVFLCEPLINTAIELQAIARVHRIGQHNPTTVWMYLVENTVEKSIYEISVNRRMAHIARARTEENGKPTEAEVLEKQIEAANTTELQEASLSQLFVKGSESGEMVGKELVWDCLFRQRPRPSHQMSTEAENEVSRHVRATAAEERRPQTDDVVVVR